MSPTTTVWWLLLQIWLHRGFSSLRNGIACASQVHYSSAFRKISSYTLLLSLYTKDHSIHDDDIFFYVHYFIDFVTQTLNIPIYMQVHRSSLLQIQPTTIQLSFPPVRLLCSLCLCHLTIFLYALHGAVLSYRDLPSQLCRRSMWRRRRVGETSKGCWLHSIPAAWSRHSLVHNIPVHVYIVGSCCLCFAGTIIIMKKTSSTLWLLSSNMRKITGNSLLLFLPWLHTLLSLYLCKYTVYSSHNWT